MINSSSADHNFTCRILSPLPVTQQSRSDTHHPHHILSVRSRSLVLPVLEGRGLQKGVTTGDVCEQHLCLQSALSLARADTVAVALEPQPPSLRSFCEDQSCTWPSSSSRAVLLVSCFPGGWPTAPYRCYGGSLCLPPVWARTPCRDTLCLHPWCTRMSPLCRSPDFLLFLSVCMVFWVAAVPFLSRFQLGYQFFTTIPVRLLQLIFLTHRSRLSTLLSAVLLCDA